MTTLAPKSHVIPNEDLFLALSSLKLTARFLDSIQKKDAIPIPFEFDSNLTCNNVDLRDLAKVFNDPNNSFRHDTTTAFKTSSNKNEEIHSGKGVYTGYDIGDIRKILSNLLKRGSFKKVLADNWVKTTTAKCEEFLTNFVKTVKQARNFAAECLKRKIPHPELAA